MTKGIELMSPAPWIWPTMTSGTAAGTCETVTDAVMVCGPVPAVKFSSRSSSVRACSEFLVVTPLTGAKKTRLPASSAVSQGGETVAGSTVAASPPDPATGSVSFQPASLAATAGGTGAAVPRAARVPTDRRTPSARSAARPAAGERRRATTIAGRHT